MHPGPDHQCAVDAALESREGGTGFGAQLRPRVAGLKPEDQRVVGEAVAAGKPQLPRRLSCRDVKAGQD